MVIAFLQWQLLDLFDRRFQVFADLRKILNVVYGRADWAVIEEVRARATYLFGNDVNGDIKRFHELCEKAWEDDDAALESSIYTDQLGKVLTREIMPKLNPYMAMHTKVPRCGRGGGRGGRVSEVSQVSDFLSVTAESMPPGGSAAFVRHLEIGPCQKVSQIKGFNSHTYRAGQPPRLRCSLRRCREATRRPSAGPGGLDIDRFKQINDRFGHAGGDAVLKMLAAVCRSAAGPGGTVGRLGGEEFGILLPAATLAEATLVAERLRIALAARACPPVGPAGAAEIPSEPIRFTASFGVAEATADAAAGLDELLAVADRRLYRAKETGRDRVVAGDPPAAEVTSADTRPSQP